MRGAILLMASVALAGCGTPARPVPAAQPAAAALPVAASQPEAAANAAWEINETPEEGAKLVFGVPETDAVAVMLSCPLRSGRVTVLVPVSERYDGRWIDMSSGAARTSRHAKRSSGRRRRGSRPTAHAASAKRPKRARAARTSSTPTSTPDTPHRPLR
jgi:hypothetical protein